MIPPARKTGEIRRREGKPMANSKRKTATRMRRLRAIRKKKLEEAKSEETKKQVAILLRSWPKQSIN